MTSSSPHPIISIQSVTKHFGGVTALNNVSFEIAAGELHAIVGENGAGKSTLMKILSGIIPQYQGQVLVNDQPLAATGTRDAEAAGISIIHQELNLVEQLSAAANIFLGREIHSAWGVLDDAAMEQAAADLFRQLQCDIHPGTLAHELRVGDQQLIEIAKALSLNAKILIMDEPTSALTETEVQRLYQVIDCLQSQGVTILYISHKMDEVFRLAHRITVLRDGQWVKTLDRSATNPTEITHLMVGRELQQTRIGDNRTPGDTVLQVEHLCLPWHGHARQWRLKDVSFSVRRGEIVGFAGLMGAGRTELLECLFGAAPEQPTGSIKLDGVPVHFTHPAQAKAAGIALVTEDRKRLGLFGQMNVGENITICTLNQTASQGLIQTNQETQAAENSVSRLHLKTDGIAASIMSLSGGNQQKAIIGRWLLTDPKVLLLDDPTRGIDVGAKAEIYRLMDQLCSQGLAIIVTSSELPELLTLCDRILVLCEGRLTGEFSRSEATEQAIMEAAVQREPVPASSN